MIIALTIVSNTAVKQKHYISPITQRCITRQHDFFHFGSVQLHLIERQDIGNKRIGDIAPSVPDINTDLGVLRRHTVRAKITGPQVRVESIDGHKIAQRIMCQQNDGEIITAVIIKLNVDTAKVRDFRASTPVGRFKAVVFEESGPLGLPGRTFGMIWLLPRASRPAS